MKIAKRAQYHIDRLKATDIITKKELITICSYVKNNRKDSEAIAICLDLGDFYRPITWQHEQQGLEYLKQTFLKKNGESRNHKGIQHLFSGEVRDVCVILEDFKEFRLVGFTDIGNVYQRHYRPYNGSYFDYVQQAWPFRIQRIEMTTEPDNVIKLFG